MIAALHASGAILAARDFAADQIQPASLDLRLGNVAYRVRASFLPGPHGTVGAPHRRSEAARHPAVERRGAGDRLRLYRAAGGKPGAAAGCLRSANPKSSTGRLDVFTRVIADSMRGFDRIEAGYRGPLYAEISARAPFRSWCAKARG